MPIAIQAALLGIVQGLTEFLPVSSSAHLILARAFFGWDSDRLGLPFDLACHGGPLIAALIYFRREVAAMITALPRLFQPAPHPHPLLLGLRRADAARFIFLLASPAILAAAGHEAPSALRTGLGGDQATLFLIGVVASAIVGYAAVRFFIRYLVNHSLDLFAWYRLGL